LAASVTLKGGHQTLRTRQNENCCLLPCFGKVLAGRAQLSRRSGTAARRNRGLAENEFVSTVPA
jgi:hypothetical protein